MTLAIENYIIAQYRGCAAKRNIEFLLTNDEVVKFFDLPCVYCGAMHSNIATRKQYAIKTRAYNGIDRINSSQPYSIGNTVVCCGKCNAAKSDLPVEEFLISEWLKLRIMEVIG
jgi:hypothetical protein